jgi:hypothetical protein
MQGVFSFSLSPRAFLNSLEIQRLERPWSREAA